MEKKKPEINDLGGAEHSDNVVSDETAGKVRGGLFRLFRTFADRMTSFTST